MPIIAKINLRKKEVNDMVQHISDNILQEDKNGKLNANNYTSYYKEHKNIKDEIN